MQRLFTLFFLPLKSIQHDWVCVLRQNSTTSALSPLTELQHDDLKKKKNLGNIPQRTHILHLGLDNIHASPSQAQNPRHFTCYHPCPKAILFQTPLPNSSRQISIYIQFHFYQPQNVSTICLSDSSPPQRSQDRKPSGCGRKLCTLMVLE